jgi:uncharacterized phiE125 gp8 family phage protein
MQLEWRNHFALSLVTPPSGEPVSVAEIHAQSYVDNSASDTLIGGYITAARRLVETFCRRQLMTAVWRYSLDQFPADDIVRLPRPPLVSVTELQYVDFAGVSQIWDSSNYLVDTYSEPGRITLAYNTFWPGSRPTANSVNIKYTAGFGDASAVPQTFKLAIMQLVAHWFENREPLSLAGGSTTLPFHVESLLANEMAGTYP